MIIKAAKRIFNSDKICRRYCDFYFGVTFLEHTVYITILAYMLILFVCVVMNSFIMEHSCRIKICRGCMYSLRVNAVLVTVQLTTNYQ